MAVDEPRIVHLTVPLSYARTSPVPWLRLFRRDTPRNRRSTACGLPVTLTSQRALHLRYV